MAARAAPALGIKAILNECQKGFAEQKKYANALWHACLSRGEPAVEELLECLLRWITSPEVGALAGQHPAYGARCAAG